METSRSARLIALSLSIVLAVFASGCASVPDVQLTPAERKIRSDRERFEKTVIGGAAQGAAVGALIGALGGALSGGDRNQVAKAAAVGAAAGGALGALDGYKTAKLQQAKMNEASALAAIAADVRRDNAILGDLVTTSSGLIADARGRLDAVKREAAANRVSAQEVNAARRREEANLAELQKSLASAKKQREDYIKVANTMNAPDQRRNVNAELSQMQSQIAKLEQNIAQYSSAITASRA
jgi:hypothetical protein